MALQRRTFSLSFFTPTAYNRPMKPVFLGPPLVPLRDGFDGPVKPPTSNLLRLSVSCSATQEKQKESTDEVTRKFGLEVGLWKIFTSKEDGGENGKESKSNQAKALLARYGGAYLATSISLSLVSFGLCYFLVNSGVDVPSLLEKVGIHSSKTGEQVGTFALAYAAHKAASPIRFPPTVALTPIVAAWFGKKKLDDNQEKND